MKKFLKIYDDSTSRYVAINADAIKFIDIATNNDNLLFYYNAQDENKDQVRVRYNAVSADVNNQIKSLVIKSMQQLMCKSYSKATVNINLPVEVLEITFI